MSNRPNFLERGTKTPGDHADKLYETPASAVRGIAMNEPLLRENRRIWEPCAGRGAIARELRKFGHEVRTTELYEYEERDPDIQTGVDFFLQRQAPEGTELILTNPPFNRAGEFVRHAITLSDWVVVLVRLAFLEGSKRSDILDYHLVRMFAGVERVEMMHRGDWEGKRLNASPYQFCWMTFHKKPHAKGVIQLRRISWRD